MFGLDGNQMYLNQYLNQGFGGMYGNCGFGGILSGMFGGFGGSIWNCGWGGSCGMSDHDFDFMAGAGVANAVVSTIGMFASQRIAERRAEKVAYVAPETQLETVKDNIKELKTKRAKAEDYIDSKYDTAITAGETRKNALPDLIRTQETTISDLKTKIETEKAKTEGKNENSINTWEAQLKKAEANKEALIKEQEKLNGDENIKGSIKYLEKQKADAIETKQKEFEAEIKELEAQKTKLEEEINQAKLDEADGRKMQRVSNEKLQGLFNKNENGKYTLNDKAEVNIRTLRAAILGYRSAQTNEAKKMYREQFNEIWEKLEQNDPNSIKESSLQKAYSIINN